MSSRMLRLRTHVPGLRRRMIDVMIAPVIVLRGQLPGGKKYRRYDQHSN